MLGQVHLSVSLLDIPNCLFICPSFFKLMVAEKNGIIRFYDLVSQQPIMSLSAGNVPLMAADWCSANPMLVGAVSRHEWHVWDMSVSRFATVCLLSIM